MTPLNPLEELKIIIKEYENASAKEDNFFFEQREISQDTQKYLQSIINNPDETELNKNFAQILYANEHGFLELYAGRRLHENTFLQSLKFLLELIEKDKQQ